MKAAMCVLDQRLSVPIHPLSLPGLTSPGLARGHGGAANRLADRLGVGRIVLVALDLSLHVLRRHQTNLVTELRQLTRPVVRRGTGLSAASMP
jgi:hypothetical protein